MGVVYRGVQLSVNRDVAIKLIGSHGDRHQVELEKRFRREAEATARLKHSNTVRLIEFGVIASGELFLVMELLEGEDLERFLERTGRLPLSDALKIARQILLSLSEAHALGVVHRDLKPSNVFLARMFSGDTEVKVMDFGMAGLEGSSKITQTGAAMGTPAYMSPEQVRGQGIDQRSDLYAVGAMLFEMLAGETVFTAPSVMAMMLAQLDTPPRPLHSLGVNVPRAVQRLVDRLIAKAPADRLQSAVDVIAAIESLELGFARTAGVVPVNVPEGRVDRVRRGTALKIVGAAIGAPALVVVGSVLFDNSENQPAPPIARAPEISRSPSTTPAEQAKTEYTAPTPAALEQARSTATVTPAPAAITFSGADREALKKDAKAALKIQRSKAPSRTRPSRTAPRPKSTREEMPQPARLVPAVTPSATAMVPGEGSCGEGSCADETPKPASRVSPKAPPTANTASGEGSCGDGSCA
jgi:serine/threonine protein kinase